MNKPIRLQRSRQYKMVSPNGLPIVYVGRPSKFGNPFVVANGKKKKYLGHWNYEFLVSSPEEAVSEFRKGVETAEAFDSPIYLSIKEELKGKNLACWCPLSFPCHADVLLEIANQ